MKKYILMTQVEMTMALEIKANSLEDAEKIADSMEGRENVPDGEILGAKIYEVTSI